MSDDITAARIRKQRSRKHARGEHDKCLPAKCDQAPGATVTEPVTNRVTITEPDTYESHGTQEPGHTVTIGDNGSRQQQARQREARALELVAQGWRQDDIATELGYQDRSGVSRAVSRALARQANVHGDELRRLTDAELTGLRDKLHHLLSLPGVSADTAIRCIGEIRKLLESRAKLAGLDVQGAVQAEGGHGNDFTGQKGFRIAIDAAPVRHLLPYDAMELNPDPSAGCLGPPLPIVVQSAATIFPETVRLLIAQGALWLDNCFFSIPAELVSDELIDAMADADTGHGPAAA